jgi:hypothetical protein
MKMTKKIMFWIILLSALCMATTVQATGENGELAGTWLGVSNLGDSRCVKIEYLGSNTYSIGPSDLMDRKTVTGTEWVMPVITVLTTLTATRQTATRMG